ncbi:DUF6896 domain-containing protein [Pseudomonas fluorescens]|uniref:DUF6896 domain-containing protein n=1 Tax=Pseudomonas fluorescens TaxID=294 RepID=UPI00381344BA
MTDKILKVLITDFLEDVESTLKLLEKKFGSRSLHQLWKDKKISQRGEVSEGISYQLHGIGCMIEFPDHCIDFDFGPNERTDGFDAWRLFNYACDHPEKYPSYTKLENIEAGLKNYEEAKLIKKLKDSYSNLYFLQ